MSTWRVLDQDQPHDEPALDIDMCMLAVQGRSSSEWSQVVVATKELLSFQPQN
jgi:hypothetical protein